MANNDVQHLLDMLYEMIDGAKNAPLTSDKCILNRDEALDLLDEIRAQLPVELSRAQELIRAKEDYVKAAKRDVERMMQQAEQDAKNKVSETEVLGIAREKSHEIIKKAEDRSREMYRVANEYTEDALRRTEEAIQMALEEVKQSRVRFRAASAEQMQKRREGEYEREHERQREEFMRPPQRKVQKKAAPVRRQREKVSLGTLCGFMALAAMVALMIMCRAQLTEISAQVVSVQKEISALEDEHVALLTRYEKTFDLTTIKEAAAAAGMAKPSASQVYYIDLSEPDSVVVYQQKSQNVLSRVLTSLGNGVCAVVEYFK